MAVPELRRCGTVAGTAVAVGARLNGGRWSQYPRLGPPLSQKPLIDRIAFAATRLAESTGLPAKSSPSVPLRLLRLTAPQDVAGGHQ